MNKIINNSLHKWYSQNKRTLPWREVNDPYLIWISEIILQQTRVDQGLSYFNRFIQSFPNVKSLAEADEEQVLKLWQGLGYYSRARNLHAAAKDIMERFGGTFPSGYKDILSLKGIGEYTAAAIASFSFGQPYAVVDGNVFRVLSRLFSIDDPIDSTMGKKVFTVLAQELLDRENPGTHNQAIMELGALQCVPNNPDCNKCPLIDKCLAYANNSISRYPVKQGKTTVKNRYFNYFDIRDRDHTYIVKRTQNDIWKNLYEFPLIETTENLPIELLLKEERFTSLFEKDIQIELLSQAKHILSHRIIYANFYKIEIAGNSLTGNMFIKIPASDIHNYPVSRLVHKYIEKYISG